MLFALKGCLFVYQQIDFSTDNDEKYELCEKESEKEDVDEKNSKEEKLEMDEKTDFFSNNLLVFSTTHYIASFNTYTEKHNDNYQERYLEFSTPPPEFV